MTDRTRWSRPSIGGVTSATLAAFALSLLVLLNAVVIHAEPVNKLNHPASMPRGPLMTRSSIPKRSVGSFTVPAIPSLHKRLTQSKMDSGLTAMVKTFNKYPQFNISMPDGATHTKKRAVEGFVAAVPANNFAEYVSPVFVGGQRINLAFDSGSSDLWVFGSALPPRSKGNHPTYDATRSKDSRRLAGSSWTIRYGDGSGASGNVFLDTVSVAGISVMNQAVEVATKVSPEFVMDPGTDGLLGLAFSSLNTVRPKKQTTFFDNVLGSLTFPIFSVDLTGDNTGTFQFGNVNPRRYRGDLQYVPVNTAMGFWQVKSNKFAIDKSVFANGKASDAIADTGTSLMLVDQAVADKYYSQVKGATFNRQAGGYTYPCDSRLPDFSVSIGDSYFATIPGRLVTFSRTRSGQCFGGIQGNGKGMMQIYGDLFFRAQYVVFDGGTKDNKPALQLAPKF